MDRGSISHSVAYVESVGYCVHRAYSSVGIMIGYSNVYLDHVYCFWRKCEPHFLQLFLTCGRPLTAVLYGFPRCERLFEQKPYV